MQKQQLSRIVQSPGQGAPKQPCVSVRRSRGCLTLFPDGSRWFHGRPTSGCSWAPWQQRWHPRERLFNKEQKTLPRCFVFISANQFFMSLPSPIALRRGTGSTAGWASGCQRGAAATAGKAGQKMVRWTGEMCLILHLKISQKYCVITNTTVPLPAPVSIIVRYIFIETTPGSICSSLG